MKPQSSDHPGTENPDPGKEERDLRAPDNPSPDSPEMDVIVTLARQFYATSFPNPQRRGCPPAGEIVKVVSRRRAPGNDLREHLFECSECFGEYRQALAQIRNEVSGWKRLVSMLSLKWVSMAAGVLFLLVFGGRLIWRKPAPDARNERIASTTPSGVSTATPVATPAATPSNIDGPLTAEIVKPPVNRRVVDGRSRSSDRPESGFETIEVDLDDYPRLRRSQEERSPIVLPATRAMLALRLPETGTAGKYTVSLIDAFGHDLLSKPAVSHDGENLRVKLDLRRVAPKQYRLRLSRKDEAPAYYDVIVRKR